MGERTWKGTTKLSDEFRGLLTKAFTDPPQPSAYGSKRKFARAVGDTGRQVSAKWLQSQDAYTIHAPFSVAFNIVLPLLMDQGFRCKLN